MKADIKRPVNNINGIDDEERQYTWPKFLTQVFWIFILLFVMVKIVQAYTS
jgi:hypothetical protein